MYEKNDAQKNENMNAFINIWNSYPILRNINEWWGTIHSPFNVTAVGRVLSHANAKRCDPKLPDLD